MKILKYLFLVVMFHATPGLSQEERCGHDERLKEIFFVNPHQKVFMDSFNQLVQNAISLGNSITARSSITIPVVVHVAWHKPEENISNERILGQIDMLNRVFTNSHDDLALVPNEFKSVIGNPNLNFCLTAEDPFGNPTNGIIRVKTEFEKIASTDNLFFDETGGSTAWDPTRFLNIWIVGPFGRTGYSSFPGDGFPHRDGIVLRYSVVDVGNPDVREGNGRVAVHEIGHYLGLHHLWGDDVDATDTLCLTDDGLSDTPLQWFFNYRCPPHMRPDRYSCSEMEMFMNFMDYSPDACLNMFTQQQVEYMRAILEVYRPGLLNSSITCMSSETAPESTFTLYPNPTDYHLRIKMIPSATVYEEVILYDIRGIQLWSQKMFLYNDINVEIPRLPNGIYIIKIANAIQRVAIVNK